MNAKQRRTARRAGNEVRHNPKAVGRPPKVGVEKGRGPRHADNVKEGDEVDLTKVNTDSVPAMLTPREAVLNRNAAEMAGRGNIEALNEEGNALAKKGVDLAGGKKDVARLQGGSENFDPATWADPGPLPSPTPDPRVYMNQYPVGWTDNPFAASQVPRQNLELINNLGWDPSKPTYGFGSGEPTRKGIGTASSIVGNAIFPGLGFLTGPLGRGLTHIIQDMLAKGASKEDVQKAVTDYKAGGGGGTGAVDVTNGAHDDASVMNTSGGGAGRGDKWHDIFGPRWSASGTPGVGVGISPTGAPAVGREWWSPDFGRYDLGNQGTGAGNYNLQGPGGWAIGSRGTGFGQGNLGLDPHWGMTAIGFDTLGRAGGGGPSNLNFTAGAWGDDAREHFNPYFGGYSQSGLTSGRGVALRAQGDSDVEEESMNTKQSKQKPQGLQGGGMAGGFDMTNRLTPGGMPGAAIPPYGWQQHQKNLATPGWAPPAQVGGLGPTPVAGGGPRTGFPGFPPMLGGATGPPEALPALPGPQQMPYGWKQHQRNLGNTTIPGLGGAGGGGFYPPGQNKFATPLAEGISDLGGPGIGANFGAAPQLSAPSGLAEMVAALKKEAQKQGLSASQISGIMQAFQGMGGGGMASYGEGSGVSNALGPALEGAFAGGYQGGISEVGYAPFAAPRATFDPYRGWVGAYDPTYIIPY